MHSDRKLIDGCRQHQQTHQEALYKKYYAYAMSVALRYTRNRDDALHVVNDSFMKVFTRIQDFDPNQAFRPWFRTILIHTALDAWRSTRSYLELIESVDDIPELQVDEQQVNSLGPDEILDLLSCLSDLQRMIFNLHEMEGFSHEEIAEILGIASGTSRCHLSRARVRLQQRYHQRYMSSSREIVY